ncbi:MAG: hypothetical protein HYZ16_05150 [Bacteroidetes bacterium]|nr:hypothetical protein [Bacteroidota bacterium]
MARKSSTDLFELIKSLGVSEKRYFKIFTSLHVVGDGNRYTQLFDLLESSDHYDDEKVCAAMGMKPGVTFSKSKKYLYDLILKAMRVYHAENNGTQMLTSAIDRVSFLFHKGLYDQADKALQKAEKLVGEYDLISYNLLLNNWRQRINLHLAQPSLNYDEPMLAEKMGEYLALSKQIEALAAIMEFTRRRCVIAHKGELPEIVQNALDFLPSKDTSAKIKFFNLRIHSIFYRLNREYGTYLIYAREVFNFAQKHLAFQNEDPITYTLEPLLEYCNALLNNRQYADFKHFLLKADPFLRDAKTFVSTEWKANIQAYIDLMESEFDRLNGRLGNAHQHLATISRIQANPDMQPSPAMINLYYWELINWQIILGNYAAAISCIGSMKIAIPSFQTIPSAIAVQWICRYEMRAFAQLKVELTDTYASKLVSTLQDSLISQLENESIGKWINLKAELQSLKSDPVEAMHFKFFDFTKWVNNKILGDNTSATRKVQMHLYG